MNENRQERTRFEDTPLGRLSKLWPVVVGLFGIMFALYSGWVTTNNNAQNIINLQSRLATLETTTAVKEFQFAEILTRLNKLEGKIDVLTDRHG